MPSLYPESGIEYYFKTSKKGDPEAKAVTVDPSPVAALAKASEITGLPRGSRDFEGRVRKAAGVSFLFRWFD
jgi:hypothetical protein